MSSPPLREPAALVLQALRAEPQHGYGLIEDVQQRSGGRLRLRTGSLYAILDRLRQAGLIEPDREEIVRSRVRRYYRITGLGAARLAEHHEQEQAAAARRTGAETGLSGLGLGGAA
jgi:DNA-binding PadR family transcriptional regulator